MQARDYKLNLWKEFMEKTPYIPERLWETMGLIAGCYVEDSGFLFKVYEAFIEGERYLEDEEHEVTYERDEKDYILAHKGTECVFTENELRKVLVVLLDLLEDTLPLGTVVNLKKSVYKDIPQIDEVEEISVVITYRFLGVDEQGYYFPYAGVMYPTGMMGREEVLYFTRPLVDEILQSGYRDERENAYVYLMKKELVIEKGLNTFGFASPDEIERFNIRVKKGAKNG
jgi:hypothetical protein